MRFSGDGKQLVTAAVGDGIVFWDVASGKKLRSVGASDKKNFSVLSSDLKTAVIVTADWQATIFNVETGEMVRRLEHFEEESAPKAFSPDGKLVVIVSEHGAALWDVRTGQKKRELRSPRTRAAPNIKPGC